jgi:cellulose synthase/poly-beta-1,6-N-acetylglucosamine synthase-like glycosyltransferase
MTLIAIFITLIYLFLIASFIYGFDKVEEFSLKDLKAMTKFSVIIPFRNEEQNLPALLESISNLNYPKELFEFIFVDDDSEDESVKALNEYSRTHLDYARCDRSFIKNKRKSKSPKKDAITLAISQAKYDWIVTTDADCILPKFWLDSFDECIQTEHPEFIVAPVTYSKMNSFLNRFQLLDVLSLQGSTIGGFGISKPFLCNGANLAYTKQIFETVNGFEGNDNIGSGDDIFMLEKVVKFLPEKVKFLKCQQAIITTLPQPNFDALISQRIRWAAKTGSYRNLFGKLVGIIVFLMNGGLLVFSLMTLTGIINLKTLFYISIIKFGIDFLLIYKTTSFTNQKEVMRTYFFAFFLYPFFAFYVVFSSVFKGYKWKGRDYIK